MGRNTPLSVRAIPGPVETREPLPASEDRIQISCFRCAAFVRDPVDSGEELHPERAFEPPRST